MSRRVDTKNLFKAWDDNIAVRDISFSVPAGEMTVLLGPSGCGKSTVLRMIAGLEIPTEGHIEIDGKDVTCLSAAKRGLSMVFQSYALFPHLSVQENIVFGLKVRHVPKHERDSRCLATADMVGLTSLLERKPAQLSGGERQRVALARAIVADQPVCLMDEPLSNLDAKLRAAMRDEIRDLQKRLGLTMIYVTHDQTEAMSMADQIVLLRQGEVEQSGPPAEMYDRPATAFAAQFIGMPPMNLIESGDLADTSVISDAGVHQDGWHVGVRPEHVELGENGVAAEVVAIEYLGAETIMRLRHDDGQVMARLAGRVSTPVGTPVNFSWQHDHTHFFDDQGYRRDVT